MCVQVQSGGHPIVSEVHALRTLFVESNLGLKRMYADDMVVTKCVACGFLSSNVNECILTCFNFIFVPEIAMLPTLSYLPPSILSDWPATE